MIKNQAHWRMGSTLEIQHCLATFIFTMRDCQTRKQFQEMGSATYFQLLFTKLAIALNSFTIVKTKTVLCIQFLNQDLASKTKTRYFLNLKLKQCKKCMARQKM